MGHQQAWHRRNHGDRREIGHRIEWQLGIKRRVDGMAGELTSSVWPSGADFATTSAARLPPAPGRFSTTTGCLRALAIGSASARATVSVVPPGEAPTNSLTGREG